MLFHNNLYNMIHFVNTLDEEAVKYAAMDRLFDFLLENKVTVDNIPDFKKVIEIQLLSNLDTDYKDHCYYYLQNLCDIEIYIEFDHDRDDFVEYFHDNIHNDKHILTY